MANFNGHEARTMPIKFEVGADQEIKFYIHPGLVVKEAMPLLDLFEKRGTGGNTSRSRNDLSMMTVSVPDVDGHTFERFVEYLYSGDYAAASHGWRVQACDDSSESGAGSDGETPASSVAGDEKNSSQDSSKVSDVVAREKGLPTRVDANRDWGLFGKHFLTPAQSAWKDFESLSILEGRQKPTPISALPRPNTAEEESYTDVFMSHARLYVFATKYSITDLQSLALQKLHGTLVLFTLFPLAVADVAAVTAYSYEQPNDSKRPVTLRSLLVKYVCCHIEKLLQQEVFQRTLNDSNEASMDILKGLMRRLR